jgi:predicted aspartyl protease
MFSPYLSVQIALTTPNAQRTKKFEAIVDSGATRCTFHADLARYLGIDLTKCPAEDTTGISGTETTRLSEIMLYIPGGPVKIMAAFKEQLPVAGLLGMNGFFEHFDITFVGGGQCFTLERIYKA